MTNQEILKIAMAQSAVDLCAAWSNVKSVRNAIKSGFRPTWVEMTAKSCEMVDGMNER